MKVLLINGSPRINGNTHYALQEMEAVFQAQGIETEIIHVGSEPIRGCIACAACKRHTSPTRGRCVFDDLVNEVAPKFEAADGIVIGTPVY